MIPEPFEEPSTPAQAATQPTASASSPTPPNTQPTTEAAIDPEPRPQTQDAGQEPRNGSNANPTDNNTTEQPAQINTPNGTQEVGQVTAAAVGGDQPEARPHTRARVDPLAVAHRLQGRPDWPEIEQRRDELIKEGRGRGLTRSDAQYWAYSEIDRLYPPETAHDTPAPRSGHTESQLSAGGTDTYENGKSAGGCAFESGGVSGLGDIPAGWPSLPANASLQAEVGWVQANRLRIVEGDKVILSRALGPAPSHAALGWLETSIRAYSKWCDIAARAASSQADEQEHVRRERLAVEEITALVAEMSPRCPHCNGLLE